MNDQLARNWVGTTLDQVVSINPKQLDHQPAIEDIVSFVPMAAVEEESGRLDPSAVKRWKEVSKGYTRFQENDVLFAKITPCMENGKYAVARGLFNGRGAGSTEFHVFRPSPAIDSKFLLFFLFQSDLRRAARLSMRGAAGQLRVPPDFFKNFVIEIPPIAEQRRIVAEIEKQFTRVDDAVAALKRVQTNLKRYRASVLKAACEGRLVPTEAEISRKEGRDYEPASELLKRILAERRAIWEADQLQKMIAAGKPPGNDDWKKKYKQPQGPDAAALPKIPQGWAWSSLEQLSHYIRNGVSTKPDQQHGLPILRISAVRPMSVDLNDVRFLTPSDEFRQFALSENDLLFTRYNGNREYVGVCGRVKNSITEVVHPDKLIRVVPVMPQLAPWIETVSNVGFSRFFLEKRVRTTAGQSGVSGEDLKQLPIPLCPELEELRISVEVDRIITGVQSIACTIKNAFARADRTRTSILKAAFSGKLVPQDPNDEPASVLLERIRAERIKTVTIKNGNQSATTKLPTARLQRRRRVEKLAQPVRAGKD